MKKRLIVTTACLAMTAAALSGCGGLASAGQAETQAEASEASAQSQAGGTDTSAESTDAASSDAGTADGEVTLEYFNVKSEVVGLYDTLISKFEEENPGIKIEQVNDPDPTTVLQTRMSTNDMPDILSHWATDPVFKEMVNNDMLLDITDQDFLSNVKPDMLDTVKYDGKVYCLPVSTNTAGVFYNKDIFDQNGIEIPTTYEEFVNVCKTLQDKGITPLAMFNQDSHAGQLLEMLMVTDLSDEEKDFSSILDGSMKVSDDAGFKSAAGKLIELNQYSQEDSFGTTYEQAISDFANGQTAMIIGGIWMIPTINEDNADLNYSTFALPASEGTETKVAYQNDHCLAISSSCEHKDEALKFLSFMSQQENAQYYADNDGSPSYISGVESNVEESKPLLGYFDEEGKIAIWPDQLWQPGMYNEMNGYADELVQSGDVDTYLENIQSVLSGEN